MNGEATESPRVHLSREAARTLASEIGPGGMFHDCEIEIGYFDLCVDEESGDVVPAGMYLWAAEYPEEGRVPLEEKREEG